MPPTSIQTIIVTWNKKDYVRSLLQSLQKLEQPAAELDLLVVDNASNDGTVAMLRDEFPDVTVLENKENLGGSGGFTRGMQWALENTSADYFWLLDNDVVVHKRALIELYDFLESHDDYAICGSSMLQLDFPFRINEIGAFADCSKGTLALNYHFFEIEAFRGKTVEELAAGDHSIRQYLAMPHQVMDVDYVAAASMLVRRDVVAEVGLWQDYFIHFDDVEWCLRIAKANFRIGAHTESMIWHVSGLFKIPTWMHYYDTRNALHMVATHRPKDLGSAIRHHLRKALGQHILGRGCLAPLILRGIEESETKRTGKAADLDRSLDNPLEELPNYLSCHKIRTCCVASTIEEGVRLRLAPLLSRSRHSGIALKSYDPSPGVASWLPVDDHLSPPHFIVLRTLWWCYRLLRHGRFPCLIHSHSEPVRHAFLCARLVISVSHGSFIAWKPSFSEAVRDTIRALRLLRLS